MAAMADPRVKPIAAPPPLHLEPWATHQPPLHRGHTKQCQVPFIDLWNYWPWSCPLLPPTPSGRPAFSFSSAQPQQPPEAAAEEEQQELIPKQEQQQGSRSPLYQALTWTANLANLLPTGTLLAFNLLAPTFTNHGACDATTSRLTAGLLALLALSCVLASFTDSVKAPDARVYYGVATARVLWLLDCPPDLARKVDTSRYRLGFIDFVHGALSAAVFAVVAARDKNVVACFCRPTPDRETAEVLDILPLGVGVLCSLLFVAPREPFIDGDLVGAGLWVRSRATRQSRTPHPGRPTVRLTTRRWGGRRCGCLLADAADCSGRRGCNAAAEEGEGSVALQRRSRWRHA